MNRFFRVCSLVAMSALVGCGGGDTEGVTVYPTSGTVTMFGKPLSGATVSFAPQGDQPTAYATTDAEGKYQLTTYEFGDGAAEGTYKVVISKATAAAAESGGGGGGEGAHDDVVIESHAGGNVTTSEVVPAQYTTSRDTPLTAEVKADGENVFPFVIE